MISFSPMFYGDVIDLRQKEKGTTEDDMIGYYH